MTAGEIARALVAVPVVVPAAAFVALGALAWSGRRAGEPATRRIVASTFGLTTLAVVVAVIATWTSGAAELRLGPVEWFRAGHHAFEVGLVLDHLSAPLSALGAAITGVIGAFSFRYLHREPGFGRFYLLLLLFGAAFQLTVLGASLDLVFVGWELVGISSALLIAFFLERPTPVRHALVAFVTYRVCDVGILAAVVFLHHEVGGTDLAQRPPLWATLPVPAGAGAAVLLGLLLTFASMGKSAQVPFSGWLPRAMEGPTPSSAVFYGALSVHLGAFLLLRGADVLDASPTVSALVAGIGLATALHATFVGRTQTDIKSVLAYATMTQVGLVFAEIGAGFRVLPLLHLSGNACVRTLQILRSPSLLNDHRSIEQALGEQLPRTGGHFERLVPAAVQPWLYRHALERGYLDALLRDQVVGRFARALRAWERVEARALDFLAGGPADAAPAAEPEPDAPGVVADEEAR